MSECLNHFSRTLAAVNPSKLFQIPSWIPKFNNLQIQFDLDPPSYRQVTTVIRKMKASGSPCPLDQISVICFKRCPFLRTYLTELIRAVWLSGTVPAEWKRVCTILIHKQGEASNPSIPLKVFTSYVRNSMYSFLTANQYIEHNIQIGFTPNLSGTLENTAQMANIINKARIKQRSLVITLLDLKNAFGEVHRQFGFMFDLLNPIHWFQFADDAAVITGQESENQHLLNRFCLWCQWSDMIIRVDKCSTFEIKQLLTRSAQYLPKLLIGNRLIPSIEIGESFKYLGRFFDFDMSNISYIYISLVN